MACNLIYCDYIGALISEKLRGDIDSYDTVIAECSMSEMDLHPEDGWMVSTKKFIHVTDKNGTKYKVTVEEA